MGEEHVGQSPAVQTPAGEGAGNSVALPGYAGVDQDSLRATPQQVCLARAAVEHHSQVGPDVDDVHRSPARCAGLLCE